MYIIAEENEEYIEYINRILSLRENKKIEVGQDLHHIIPKSRGGHDNEENLIWLYRCEHAKAHQLYSNEHPDDDGMALAAYMLSHKDNILLTNDEMNILAKRNAKNSSLRNSGKNNPMYGKHHSSESILKNSNSHKGKNTGEKNYFYNKSFSGKAHPRYGKHWDEKHKINQSNKMIGRYSGDKNPRAVSIRCIETNMIFTTLKDAAEWCGLKHPSDISNHINGKNLSAGKHPITKIKLHWEYVK